MEHTRATVRRRRGLGAALLMALVAVGVTPEGAHAQPGTKAVELAPPRPSKEDNNRPILMNYLVFLVILAAAVGASCIPAKRGHQD